MADHGENVWPDLMYGSTLRSIRWGRVSALALIPLVLLVAYLLYRHDQTRESQMRTLAASLLAERQQNMAQGELLLAISDLTELHGQSILSLTAIGENHQKAIRSIATTTYPEADFTAAPASVAAIAAVEPKPVKISVAAEPEKPSEPPALAFGGPESSIEDKRAFRSLQAADGR